MDHEEFRKLVVRMREKQREFFNPKTRRGSSADDAKALERQVDKALEEYARPPGLFDQLEAPSTCPPVPVARMIAEVDETA